MKLQPRKRVLRRHIYIRVTFVVTQDDVEARFVPLDQVVLEYQRLGFGVGHRNLDVRYQLPSSTQS